MKMILVVINVLQFSIKLCAGKLTAHFEAGYSTFGQVVNSETFIDKTSLISDYFSILFVLIMAPRRFGKTINMDMIKTFYDIQVNENGTVIPREQTENYNIFTKKNLIIRSLESGSFFNQHFGRHPVLHLDFKVLRGTCWNDFVNDFKDMVKEVYGRYKYLLQSSTLDKKKKEVFQRFYFRSRERTLPSQYLIKSLVTLIQLLYSHFKTKVFLLIDEYDSPLHEAIFNAGSDTDRILMHIQSLIWYFLKTNTYVGRALLNARIRLGAVLSCYANHIVHLPFTEKHNLNKYYGVTELELLDLAKRFKVEDKIARIKEWYGGYRIAGTTFSMCNTYSVVNYLKNLKFRNYWAQMDYQIKLEKMSLHDAIYDKIMTIVIKNSVEINKMVELENYVYILKNMTNNAQVNRLVNKYADLYLNVLLDLGYFTTLDRSFVQPTSFLTIPNREVRCEIEGRFKSLLFLKEKFKTTDRHINAYVQAVIRLGEKNSTYVTFGKSLFKFYILRYFPKNEKELRSTLFPFLWYYDRQFVRVESELSTGRAKFIDLFIIRKDFTGIIIQLKTKGGTSYEALNQIVRERYYDSFNNFTDIKLKNTILIGLYLDKKGKCRLSYLYNSTDLSKAVNMSIIVKGY